MRSQAAPAQEQAVLEPNADVTTYDRAHRNQRHLMAFGAEHRELIVPAAADIRWLSEAHDERLRRIFSRCEKTCGTYGFGDLKGRMSFANDTRCVHGHS